MYFRKGGSRLHTGLWPGAGRYTTKYLGAVHGQQTRIQPDKFENKGFSQQGVPVLDMAGSLESELPMK